MKKRRKKVSNSTLKHTDLITIQDMNRKLEKLVENKQKVAGYRFLREGSEKGLIPNGSLFSDAKHCFDHSVTSSMLNCFTTPFYYRVKQANKQTNT